MDQAEILAQIRNLIREKLNHFGSTAEVGPNEAMLIRNGHYCGRRFQSDGLQAVWFIEEQQIKFYDRDGALLEVLEVTAQILQDFGQQRRAA